MMFPIAGQLMRRQPKCFIKAGYKVIFSDHVDVDQRFYRARFYRAIFFQESTTKEFYVFFYWVDRKKLGSVRNSSFLKLHQDNSEIISKNKSSFSQDLEINKNGEYNLNNRILHRPSIRLEIFLAQARILKEIYDQVNPPF